MLIRVERFGLGRDSTLGELMVDGLHDCYTLEDERRKTKVQGETCIPAGRYEILLRAAGGLHDKYLARFPHLHRGMLWLQDVPGFKWIYLHIGNDDNDTFGCILVGRYPVILPSGEFKLAESTAAYTALYRRVLDAFTADELIEIEITQRPPAP